jgi:SAM-dependent methyltransferase
VQPDSHADLRPDLRPDLRAAWDRLSPIYQAHHEIPTASVHYGPWAPLESELNLLGDVAGRRILEIGCGGGQCCVAFARAGAVVAGVDLSDVQLAFARQMAEQARVTVQFVQGSADDLAAFAENAYDLVFSVNTVQYVAEMAACLAECHRVLRPGGRLVFSLDHPLRDCFFDAETGEEDDEMSIIPARSYFDSRPNRWRWGNTGILLQTYHRSIGQWTDLLAAAGFQLQRIVEPAPPVETLDSVWPADDALAPLRLIPHVIIFVAQKP